MGDRKDMRPNLFGRKREEIHLRCRLGSIDWVAAYSMGNIVAVTTTHKRRLSGHYFFLLHQRLALGGGCGVEPVKMAGVSKGLVFLSRTFSCGASNASHENFPSAVRMARNRIALVWRGLIPPSAEKLSALVWLLSLYRNQALQSFNAASHVRNDVGFVRRATWNPDSRSMDSCASNQFASMQ